MSKLHYSIVINAPKEKVWNTMLDKVTYSQWTAPFSPTPSTTSSFEGNWEQGSKIRFVAPDENGKLGGMISMVETNRQYEFISLHHIGVVLDGVEDTTSEEAKKWEGYENYTLKEQDGKTELLVDITSDFDEEFAKFFDEAWPKALQILKELSEK